MNPARIESDARDRAQFILGAISLVIWFAVAFTLGVKWFIDEDTPQPILMAGGIALMVAAVPWLVYPWLVRRLRATRNPEPGTLGRVPVLRRLVELSDRPRRARRDE